MTVKAARAEVKRLERKWLVAFKASCPVATLALISIAIRAADDRLEAAIKTPCHASK